MHTIKVPSSRSIDNLPLAIANRYKLRDADADSWILQLGSGTLNNSKNASVEWHPLYRQERVAFEYGDGFDLIPHTRITFGTFIAEGDCPVTTHVAYYWRCLQKRSIFGADVHEIKYIHLFTDNSKREGAGIIVTQTDSPWLPSGYTIYALISEWNPEKKAWGPINNPC